MELGYCPGDGVRDIDGNFLVRFPETVRTGETLSGRFQIADAPTGFTAGQSVTFDTDAGEFGFFATNVRSA